MTPGKKKQGMGEAAPQVFFWLLLALLAALIAWMAGAEVDVVAVAPGDVEPSSRVKQIQHLEGGIVRELLIREGDTVKAGQPMVVLESTARGADAGELQARESTLRIRIARLEAEAEGRSALVLGAPLLSRAPAEVQQARELLQGRLEARRQQEARVAEKVTQRRQAITELQVRLRNAESKLALLNEQIAISESLLQDKLTTRFNHLEYLRQRTDLQGRIEEDRAGLKRTESALQEALAEQGSLGAEWDVEVRRDLEGARAELQEVIQRQAKAEDALGRTVLRAPEAGVVKVLRFATVGGVIRPGEVVAEVVPLGDQLVIRARLSPHDVSFVRPGQKASVRLASGDALRFGALPGRVQSVSPDTRRDEDGPAYYEVRVITQTDAFERNGRRYPLFPGMEVTASIQTHRRTVFDTLFSPFLGDLDRALGER